MDFENDHHIEVMTSTALKGKAPAKFDWQSYYKTFERVVVTPRQLAVLVYKGYAITPVWETARREENFISAQHMAFDFDAGDESSSLASLMADSTFAWLFCSFGYTTPSHTTEAPRSRLVFVLEYPIYDPAEYRLVYQTVARRIALDGGHTDPACKDPLRLYYGSPGCEVAPNWSVLGKAVIDIETAAYVAATPAVERGPVLRQRAEPDGNRQRAQLQRMGDRVRLAPANEGHATLLRMAKWAGGFVASGALSEGDVKAALMAAYMARSTSTSADERDAERAIESGLGVGKASPVHFETATPLGSMLR